MKNLKLTKPLLILAALVFMFGRDFVSDLSNRALYQTTPATIISRSTKCRLVTRDANGKRQNQFMACDEAFAARRADHTKKTRAYRRTYVTLEFYLQSGRRFSTRVRANKVGAMRGKVGDQINISYKPGNPKRVFKPARSGSLLKNALLFLVCAGLLMLVLFGGEGFKRILKGGAPRPRTRRADQPSTESAPVPQPVEAPPPSLPRARHKVRVRTGKRKAKGSQPPPPNVVSRRRGWFGFAS